MRKQKKKLYWLEYTDCGPLLASIPFAAVGFDVKDWGWHPDFPQVLLEDILTDVIAWEPDIIVFWLALGYWKPLHIEEPKEWVEFCKIIRKHPKMQHTKIMGFLGSNEISNEQQRNWDKRYDFWTSGQLRVVEHGILAQNLVGTRLEGFEGVNYYLLNSNGHWKVREKLLQKDRSAQLYYSGMEGEFTRVPKTRILEKFTQAGPVWTPRSIKANLPTTIVYVHKDTYSLSGFFARNELENISNIANVLNTSKQWLIGVQQNLLTQEPNFVQDVLDQAKDAGDWKIFITEHMWYEIMPGPGYDDVVYNNRIFKHWEYPFAI